jgi:hypothetical protein
VQDFKLGHYRLVAVFVVTGGVIWVSRAAYRNIDELEEL